MSQTLDITTSNTTPTKWSAIPQIQSIRRRVAWGDTRALGSETIKVMLQLVNMTRSLTIAHEF